MVKIIAIGRAISYWSHISPPPRVKATNAGAPSILLVEHCVAIVEMAIGKKPISFPPK